MHNVDLEPSRFTGKRRAFIEQMRSGGVTDRWVLAAVAAVPREPFAFPVEGSFVVGAMAQAIEIETGDSVLEIGTGSGYSAAVLSMLAGQVFTVECDAGRATAARTRLDVLGYRRISVQCADGGLGWPENAPFARIVVRATGHLVPPALLDQLAVGGRLVMPLLRDDAHILTRVTRSDHASFAFEPLGPIRCSPLFGEGWPDRHRAPDTD